MSIHSAVSVFVVSLLLVSAGSGRAAEVSSGSDCWRTDPGDAELLLDLPADFFDTGSQPVSENVLLEGVPLSLPVSMCDNIKIIWLNRHDAVVGPDSVHRVKSHLTPPGNSFDTVVQRIQTAQLPGVSSSDTIDIEIVELSLKSVTSITVVTGGSGVRQYEVRVTLDGTNPSLPGSLTLTAQQLTGPHVSGTLVMPSLPVNWVLDLVPLDGGPDPAPFSGNSEFTSGPNGGTFDTAGFLSDIPAMREWGLVLLGLGLLAQMAWVIRTRLARTER